MPRSEEYNASSVMNVNCYSNMSYYGANGEVRNICAPSPVDVVPALFRANPPVNGVGSIPASMMPRMTPMKSSRACPGYRTLEETLHCQRLNTTYRP